VAGKSRNIVLAFAAGAGGIALMLNSPQTLEPLGSFIGFMATFLGTPLFLVRLVRLFWWMNFDNWQAAAANSNN